MKKVIFENRIKNLIEILKRKKIDGFILGISANMYYFTNYYGEQRERFFGLFVSSVGDPVFLVPEINYEQICEITWINNVISWKEEEDPFEKIASIIKGKKLPMSKIAIDDTLRGDFLLAIQEKLPQVKFVSGNKYTGILRRIKSNYEKELMMHIGNVHDKVLKKVISEIKIGVTESKIADLVTSTFREFGATSLGRPLIASGAYSAQPHYSATEKEINDCESIILDFGGIWKNYKSDMTRTVFLGNPNEEYLKIYNTVKKAQEAGVQSVKPGRTCEEIDQIVRKIIEKKGYGQYFIHRTGHGIGLDDHEEPYIIEGNKLVLEPGMTFSIEPGIYIPGKYGVRIEDCVIVTEKGAEPFTKFTHDLIII